MSHVFGPIPSRRLGRSLGVDLLPFKTCSYDCLYCELGCTTRKTIEPFEDPSVDLILSEIKEKLTTHPDYITIAGSGEPTLYMPLGRLLEAIKKLGAAPVAVLTNGSTLWRPEVRESLIKADVVMPSLVSVNSETYELIHKPSRELKLEEVLDGFKRFRKMYSGAFWLEVFLLEGINTSEAELIGMAAFCRELQPDRILVNSLDRPPAYMSAKVASPKTLNLALNIFGPLAEVISRSSESPPQQRACITVESIEEVLKRRPCTLNDLASGLGTSTAQVAPLVQDLLLEGKIVKIPGEEMVFYSWTGNMA